jgi:hypothetical protein
MAPKRSIPISLRGSQPRGVGQLIYAENNTGIPEVRELHGEAEPIGGAAALPDYRKVGLAQGVAPDQVVSIVRQSQQTIAFGSGKDGATGHGAPLANGGL